MSDQRNHRSRRPLLQRRGLTLIELVVVIAILVALSGLVIPLIQGLGFQTNSAINATVVDDVNRSIQTFSARLNAQPDHWDSLLNITGSGTAAFYNKLHPSLTATPPVLLSVAELTQTQLDSLNGAGIYNVRDADESVPTSTLSPNANDLTIRPLVVGGKVATLAKVGSASSATVLDGGFKISQPSDGDLTNEFVVFGLGSQTTIQGVAMMQIPLIQSADPASHYARVCCVYMIPSSDATTTFPARYVGCFMPDGTTSRKNMENYNNALTD